jgi:hypothetical protein
MINHYEEKKIKLPVVNNVTCYEAVDKNSCSCERKSCKQWIDFPQGKNCTLITTQAGPLTLNEIGKIYGLTRMRICQIEKNIYQKIRNFIQM